jgi:hypothetical protein
MNMKDNSNEPDICPCIDCICIPMCRNKTYTDLLTDCILIENYRSTNGDNRIKTIEHILKPLLWTVEPTCRVWHYPER